MIYTIELNDDEKKIVDDFTQKIGMNVPDFAKECVIDYVDLSKQADEAWAEYEKDPVTYTHEEVGRSLGLVS